jgi:hypothetical protein
VVLAQAPEKGARPIYAGFSFDGWFTAPSGGSALTSPYALAGFGYPLRPVEGTGSRWPNGWLFAATLVCLSWSTSLGLHGWCSCPPGVSRGPKSANAARGHESAVWQTGSAKPGKPPYSRTPLTP